MENKKCCEKCTNIRLNLCDDNFCPCHSKEEKCFYLIKENDLNQTNVYNGVNGSYCYEDKPCKFHFEPPQESWEEGFGNLLDRLGIFLEFDQKEIVMNCISNLLSSEKAKWEKEKIIIKKGTKHLVHDDCEICFEKGLQWNNPEIFEARIKDATNKARTQFIQEIIEKLPKEKKHGEIESNLDFIIIESHNSLLSEIKQLLNQSKEVIK